MENRKEHPLPVAQSVIHPDHVVGWNGSLEDLAKAVGNMRYDTLAHFVELLSEDINEQASADSHKGRVRLSARLNTISHDLNMVKHGLRAAWKICEPFMRRANFQAAWAPSTPYMKGYDPLNQGQVLGTGPIENPGE